MRRSGLLRSSLVIGVVLCYLFETVPKTDGLIFFLPLLALPALPALLGVGVIGGIGSKVFGRRRKDDDDRRRSRGPQKPKILPDFIQKPRILGRREVLDEDPDYAEAESYRLFYDSVVAKAAALDADDCLKAFTCRIHAKPRDERTEVERVWSRLFSDDGVRSDVDPSFEFDAAATLGRRGGQRACSETFGKCKLRFRDIEFYVERGYEYVKAE